MEIIYVFDWVWPDGNWRVDKQDFIYVRTYLVRSLKVYWNMLRGISERESQNERLRINEIASAREIEIFVADGECGRTKMA